MARLRTWSLFLRLFVALFFCAVAFFVWFVQPDRNLLRNLEKEIEATSFNEVARLMAGSGFTSQTLTYYALADRFSRGDGARPMVFMSPEVRKVFLTLCPKECQVILSEKQMEVPLLGMDRIYKFHSVYTDLDRTEVLSDHAFWVMYLP